MAAAGVHNVNLAGGAGVLTKRTLWAPNVNVACGRVVKLTKCTLTAATAPASLPSRS